MDYKDAWPSAKPLSVLSAVGSGEVFTQFAVGDGPVLYGMVADHSAKGDDVGGIGVGAVDVKTSRLSLLHSFPSRDYQIGGMDTDGTYLVWEEDHGRDVNPDGWEVWVLDLRDGSARRIARQELTEAGTPPPGVSVVPRIDRGVIVYAATTPALPLGKRYTVYRADATTGDTQPLAVDGFAPHISWRYVSFIGLDPSGTGKVKSYVQIVNLSDGSTQRLANAEQVPYQAIGGRTVTWVGPPPNDSVHVEDLSGVDRIVRANRTSQFPSAIPGASLIDGYNDGPLVYLTGASKLVRLVHRQSQGFVSGHWLVWYEGTPDPVSYSDFVRIQVLDLATVVGHN